MHWYSDLQCRVQWGDTFSIWFCVKAGVRQGIILSPIFYCLYVDDLVAILSKLNTGCHTSVRPSIRPSICQSTCPSIVQLVYLPSIQVV